MTDHTKPLPIRTETEGDVAVKIVDKTNTAQQLTVNADGSINVNVPDLTFADDKVDVTGSVVGLDSTTLSAIAPITGFATEAKQDTQITLLTNINDKFEAENIRQKILKSADRESYITYADFGTKNQRVTKIEYLTSTIPTNTASKVISYTLVGNKYKRDSINWIIT